MAVKKGYKQTEVGVIPEDWECVELGACVNYLKGYPFKSADYKKNGIRIIRVSDTTYDNISNENAVFIDSSRKKEFSSWELFENDIVVSTVGSKPPMFDSLVGRAILIDSFYAGSLLNQNAVVLRTKNVNSQLLYENLKRPSYIKHIVMIFRGNANQASITLVELFRYKFPIPLNIKEQKAIASALSDIDGLINSLTKLIEKKKNIKQGAMQELLTGKKRLDGFSGEWMVYKIVNLGKTYGGLSGKTKVNFGHGDHRYIPFMNVMSNPIIDLSFLEYVHIKNGEFQNSVQYGDLFFNTSSETPEEVGMSSVLLTNVKDVYLNSFCFGFRLNNLKEINPLFLSCLFRSNTGRDLMFALAQGATRYNLSKSNFNNLEVIIPKYDEQTTIATILSDMDSEIEKYQLKLDKYKAIKQGMMQELLTGRIRLLEGA